MQFNPAAFDRHLVNIGQKVEWRRSYICPCVNPQSGQSDPKHALCSGKGRIWDDPIPTVTGVASQKVQMQWAAMGMYEEGDSVLSVPQNSPLWEAGQFDRVTMLNSTSTFSMTLRRGEPSEKFLFKPVSINRVFWLHPQTRVVVEGGIPVVGTNGIPSWPGSVGEPPPGVGYSINGTKNDEYFIFMNLMSDRNEHSGMRLPKRVVARKWDLLGRSNVAG